ncbi:hypothetical protein [Vibrio furnissii]|nr:hypothetical protein [Vibrio furnissii]MCG6216081.1 hypothetical protein [Vibrio furnissii]
MRHVKACPSSGWFRTDVADRFAAHFDAYWGAKPDKSLMKNRLFQDKELS